MQSEEERGEGSDHAYDKTVEESGGGIMRGLGSGVGKRETYLTAAAQQEIQFRMYPHVCTGGATACMQGCNMWDLQRMNQHSLLLD